MDEYPTCKHDLRDFALAMKRRIFCAFLFGAALTVQHSAGIDALSTLIVPPELADTFGSTSGQLFVPTPIFQQVYGAAGFGLAPTDVMEITSIAFRFDETEGSGFDAIIPSATLEMGVSENPGGDIPTNLPSPIHVYSGSNLRFSANANRTPSQFDIVFPLQKPFLYDRRKGALVLQGSFKDNEPYGTDGALGSHTRGFYLYYSPMPFTQQVLVNSVDVTQFTYRAYPVITSVQVNANKARIQFESPSIQNVVIEGSESVTSSFEVEPSLSLRSVGTNKVEAVLARKIGKHFWRVKLQD